MFPTDTPLPVHGPPRLLGDPLLHEVPWWPPLAMPSCSHPPPITPRLGGSGLSGYKEPSEHGGCSLKGEFATPRRGIARCGFRNNSLEGKARVVLRKCVYTDIHTGKCRLTVIRFAFCERC